MKQERLLHKLVVSFRIFFLYPIVTSPFLCFSLCGVEHISVTEKTILITVSKAICSGI